MSIRKVQLEVRSSCYSLALKNSPKLFSILAGQEKTQFRLPRASKFCSWASENGSLVARWASETTLSSLVSDNSSQKQFKNLRLQDEQNNELKAFFNLTLSLLERPKAANRKWPFFPRAAKSGQIKLPIFTLPSAP